jgi:hypothetical protein
VALVDRLAEFLQLQLERIEQAAQLLRALFAETFGLVFQDSVREILERFAQALLGLFEQLQLLRRRCRLRCRTGFERGMAAGQCDQLRLGIVTRAARAGEFVAEALGPFLLRGCLGGDRAQVLFGMRPVLFVAANARSGLLGTPHGGVALLHQRGNFGIASRLSFQPRLRAPALRQQVQQERAREHSSRERGDQWSIV